jgi:hypothetical protein
MKNLNQTAAELSFNGVSCAARNITLKSSKLVILLSVGLLLGLSSCSRGSGCGAWTYKQQSERKAKNQYVKMFKANPSTSTYYNR